MSYKVSVIVPVYNAGKFLESTINSVVNQTIGFENIELILVDDNSGDNSRDIIMDYAGRHDNIKPVLFDSNTGSASKPRNIGIDKSTAPYIIFLDSDDGFYEDYCEVLYNSINSKDVDIVHCEQTRKFNDLFLISNSIPSIDFTEKEILGEDKLFLRHTCWGSIYKSSFLKDNNIKFLDMLFEDIVFSFYCLHMTEKDVFDLHHYPGYIYLIENDESITHKTHIKTVKDFLKCLDLIYGILRKNCTSEFTQKFMNSHIQMLFFILMKLDNPGEGIEMLYDFENGLDIDLNPGFMPLSIINNKIKSGKFKQALFLIKSMGLLYNNKKLRSMVIMKYSNLKEIDLK